MNATPPPPSGATPPERVLTSDGTPIELKPLAAEVCRRYRAEFPDEQQRYGPAGVQWCLHDNQYLLAWAIQDARDGTVVLAEQALWLAGVLENRGFPVARLARDLEIAAEVARASPALGELGEAAEELLVHAAGSLGQSVPET
ncbi:MAG TPA: hypothetical protein VFP55_00850 [Solirubrobacteraceae bacterium]|nr:hypothetical protein [Solirubrobacteraceae bacterium]